MNEFIVTINDRKHTVKIFPDNKVEINGKIINADFSVLNKNAFLLKYGNKIYEITSNNSTNGNIGFLIEGWYFDTIVRTKLQETASEIMMNKSKFSRFYEVKAPMPGLVLKVLKKHGEKVLKGEPLVILEAMKMENEIRSLVDGVVTEILISEGKPVEKNSLMLVIE